MAVVHNGNPTNTAALAGQLIPQESPSSRPIQPRASSDPDVLAHLVGREADLSLEGAIVHTRPGLEDVTGTAVLARIGPIMGPCAAWGPGSSPIIPAPDTATATLRPFVTTRPTTLPLPNPEPEVAR